MAVSLSLSRYGLCQLLLFLLSMYLISESPLEKMDAQIPLIGTESQSEAGPDEIDLTHLGDVLEHLTCSKWLNNNYPFVSSDRLGNLAYVCNYIQASNTGDNVVHEVEVSEYDPVCPVATVTDDMLFEDWNLCDYGKTTICLPDVSLSLTGEHLRTCIQSPIRGVSGPLTVNGMTFNEVRLEQNISPDNAR